MSGLHKSLAELDQRFTPESWERIARLEAEVDATMPPDESCPVAPMRTLREMVDPPLAELATALQTRCGRRRWPLRNTETLRCRTLSRIQLTRK